MIAIIQGFSDACMRASAGFHHSPVALLFHDGSNLENSCSHGHAWNAQFLISNLRKELEKQPKICRSIITCRTNKNMNKCRIFECKFTWMQYFYNCTYLLVNEKTINIDKDLNDFLNDSTVLFGGHSFTGIFLSNKFTH